MIEKEKEYLANNKELLINLKVFPGAPANSFSGRLADGTLKVKIAAIPEDGRANKELIAFMAKSFGVKKRQVSLLKGLSDRRKVLKITLI
jgi:hypothetical protein